MNVFKIHKGIREVGLNYGVPVIFVDCGIGVNYSTEDLVKKLVGMDLRKGSLVVIRDGMSQKGIGTFVSALKYLNIRVEVEATSRDSTPGWFPEASYWMVRWLPGGTFNQMALRARQDLLLFEGRDINEFVKATEKVVVERGMVLDGQTLIETLYAHGIRVYRKGLDVK